MFSQTNTFHRHFTESWKIFTSYATITDGIFLFVYFQREFFWHSFSVCKTICIFFYWQNVELLTKAILTDDTHFLSVKPFVFFFIDRMWNYWRKLSWQTHSVEDLVGKTFTDEVVISHQRIWSVGKTVKCCSGCLVEVGMLCAYHWNTTTHPYIFGQCYKHTITQFLSSLSIALASNHKWGSLGG